MIIVINTKGCARFSGKIPMQDLFADFLLENNPIPLIKLFRNNRFMIFKAVLISLFFHFTLGLVLFLSSDFSSDLAKYTNQEKSLFDVIAQSKQTGSLPQGMSEEMLTQIKEYEDLLKKIIIQDSSLEKDDISQLTNSLVESLIALQKGYVSLEPSDADSREDQIFKKIKDSELDSGIKLFIAPLAPGKNEIKFSVLTKDKSEAFNKLSDKLTAEKEDFIYSGQRVRINIPNGGFKIVPEGYFFRDSPYEELLALGADLFYIVTGFPSIYKKTKQIKKIAEDRNSVENIFLDLKKFDVFLVEKTIQGKDVTISDAATQKTESKKTHIDEREIDQILNDLMTLPELEQLEKFQTDYLDKNEIDDQSLTELTHEFTRNNLSTLMFDISDITSAFDYIEEIYFNKTLDHIFYKIWLKTPSSKIGVEFLLCMASHIRFEKNGLYYLQKAYKGACDFLSQTYNRTEMFNKRQKSFVIKDLYDDLLKKLPLLGFHSMEQVLAFYQEVEIGVYNLIIDLDEEAKNIGLFERGRHAWDNEQYLEALEHWKNIDDSYSTKNLQDIRRVISQNLELPQIILDINSSLNWYSESEQREFIARLVQFGKWKNRYKKD